MLWSPKAVEVHRIAPAPSLSLAEMDESALSRFAHRSPRSTPGLPQPPLGRLSAVYAFFHYAAVVHSSRAESHICDCRWRFFSGFGMDKRTKSVMASPRPPPRDALDTQISSVSAQKRSNLTKLGLNRAPFKLSKVQLGIAVIKVQSDKFLKRKSYNKVPHMYTVNRVRTILQVT
jgi:hypothetical protein